MTAATSVADVLGVPVQSFEDMLAGLTAIGASPEKVTGGYALRCPHPDHDDDTPSATLRPGDRTPWLLHCHACAPARGTEARAQWVRQVVERVAAGTPLPPASPRARRSSDGSAGRGVAVASYDYVDAAGQLVGRKVRYATDDRRGKSFSWWRPVGDGWAERLGRTPVGALPMYGLPSLDLPGPVYVVEGEKDADRLHSLGVPAVSAAGGAKKDPAAVTLPEDVTPLAGRDVVIVGDRDDAGTGYAWAWRDRLAGIAASVRLARAAADHPGADVSDHLDAGHDLAALDYGPAANEPPGTAAPDHPQHGRRLTLTPASGITPRRAKWLWSGRLAMGTLAILAGREGVGKSTLAYWAAAQVTRGTLPGEHHGQPGAVLIAATEDSWAHTVVPRLIAAEADLGRVYRVDVATDLGGAELSLPTDVQAVGEAARQVGATLLLLDPLMSRLSATLDTHKDQETRQALEPLVRMLDDTGMVGLGLMHFNKSGTDDPMNALMASRAFAAVARSVSTVVRDPDDDTGRRRLFGTPKNNLGPDDLPLMSFTLEPFTVPTPDGDTTTSHIAWGEEVADSIGEVLRRTNAGPDDRTATQEAADWLGDYLSQQGGQAESSAVKAAARAAGHSERAVSRARQRIGVASSSSGFPRRTVWHLPEDSRPQSCQSSRATSGETHITDTTGTTGSSQASRASCASRETRGEAGTTGGPGDAARPPADPTALTRAVWTSSAQGAQGQSRGSRDTNSVGNLWTNPAREHETADPPEPAIGPNHRFNSSRCSVHDEPIPCADCAAAEQGVAL